MKTNLSIFLLLTIFLILVGCNPTADKAGKKTALNSVSGALSPSAGNATLANDNQHGSGDPLSHAEGDGTSIRFATFNCSMSRGRAGQLIEELKDGQNEQAFKVAQIIQIVKPDVLLLNEFDFDEDGMALKLFRELYLGKGSGTTEPIEFGFAFTGPVNTGVESGIDMNKDGRISLPDDGFGFGRHSGHYGMVVLSRFEIDRENVRTFQKFAWKDLPGAMLPKDENGELFYNQTELEQMRLSSKSHWDLPVLVGDESIHFLVCHPTPPVFDGAEDRNGCRNHDEIRFWAEFIKSPDAEWIVDDAGNRGGLAKDSRFVIAGDLNADPHDGDSREQAARLLTENPLIANITPSSAGGLEQAAVQGGVNLSHKGPAEHDTGDFNDRTVGNLRVDYVLPSANQNVQRAGVFWPASTETGFDLISASDHRLVWIDVQQ